MAKAAKARDEILSPVPQIEGEDEQPKQKKVEPDDTEPTKCFRVSHPALGAVKVFVDTEAEAVAVFCERRGLKVEAAKDQLHVREQVFVPADTEKDQPGGWRRKKPVKVEKIT